MSISLPNLAEMVTRELQLDLHATEAETMLFRAMDTYWDGSVLVDTKVGRWRIKYANEAFSSMTGPLCRSGLSAYLTGRSWLCAPQQSQILILHVFSVVPRSVLTPGQLSLAYPGQLSLALGDVVPPERAHGHMPRKSKVWMVTYGSARALAYHPARPLELWQEHSWHRSDEGAKWAAGCKLPGACCRHRQECCPGQGPLERGGGYWERWASGMLSH